MPLQYSHENLPAPGETIEVAPGVRWLRMPLPYALDHVNVWLIRDGGDAWAAVDTGIALDAVKDAWRKVLAEHRLSRQIVTHFHPDHVGLAAWLEQETGAPLWMTQGEYATAQLVKHQIANYGIPAMTAFFRRHGLDAERVAAIDKRGNAYGRGVPALPDTFRRMFEGEKFAIGDDTWQVIPGFGHSAEHASLYCAERHILVSGDMLLPRISTNVSAFAAAPEADPLGTYLASIDRFRALPEDTLILPSHGKPFRGLHERIEQLHAHHQERCGALLEACAGRPQSAAELLPALFERDITDPHQTMFAMGEAIAHLIYLEQTHAMTRVVHDDTIRFVDSH
jgi:glyoxylase-like metal-dependent hydrolase (beta-lactamase superfamily II)